ncbi:MAG: thioredoxin [Ilyomonas sp.]
MEAKESLKEILEGERPVLVDFSAEWCGPCKMMKPILDDLHKQMGDSVRILKIDVDRNPKLSAAYQISGVPTLILFQKGKVLWRQSGVMQAKQLANVIHTYAKDTVQ